MEHYLLERVSIYIHEDFFYRVYFSLSGLFTDYLELFPYWSSYRGQLLDESNGEDWADIPLGNGLDGNDTYS